jgi:hypothetical protein
MTNGFAWTAATGLSVALVAPAYAQVLMQRNGAGGLWPCRLR